MNAPSGCRLILNASPPMISGWVLRAENRALFRGPAGAGPGCSPETNVPLQWSAMSSIAWKGPLSGESWSSSIGKIRWARRVCSAWAASHASHHWTVSNRQVAFILKS